MVINLPHTLIFSSDGDSVNLKWLKINKIVEKWICYFFIMKMLNLKKIQTD